MHQMKRSTVANTKDEEVSLWPKETMEEVPTPLLTHCTLCWVLLSWQWLFLVVYLTGGLSGSILATSFGSLIPLYGTLGGAYFGIKVTSDAANKNAAGGDRAENIAKEALVDLPSDQADRIRQRLSEL